MKARRRSPWPSLPIVALALGAVLAVFPPMATANSPAWPTLALGPTDGLAQPLDEPPCPTDGDCPVNSALPTISGTATERQTLSEVPGTWTNAPTSFSYQWEDCDPLGNNCSPITGATAQMYVLTSADVGQTIRVIETAANASGSSDPAVSAQTALVLPLPPANLTPPTITGTPTQGQALTETPGTWTNTPTTFAYQWQDCDSSGSSCTAIAGATGQTYVLTATDLGHTIEVQETATNAGGPSPPASSAPSAVVQAPPASPSPPVNQSPPVISGTGVVGSPLSTSPGTWAGTPPITYGYQWQRCAPACAGIAGATAATYSPTPADVGATLIVVVTATNPAGTAPASSAVFGPIPPLPPSAAQIKASLLKDITPSGSTLEIAAVLQAGHFTLPMHALTAGLVQVAWEDVPPGATVRSAPPQALVVASGSLSFAAAGEGQVRLRLTAAGTQLLRGQVTSHVKSLALTTVARFTPTGQAPIPATASRILASATLTPPCFGAAALASSRPCNNPSLRLSVTPTPDQAVITPNAPCTVVLPDLPPVYPCAFGAPTNPTTPEVALVGDSHAEHWRAALTVVANAVPWYAVSLTRSSCPFSQATPQLPPSLLTPCLSWRSGVIQWFRANPQVHTVFVSDNDYARIVTMPAQSRIATEVQGFLAIWHLLPPSVTHIVVIRDPPFVGVETAGCVDRAIAHHVPAGAACALPRSSALQPDAAAIAASKDEPRASVIDMTGFFCGPQVCPPVIGGVLVYKDSSHLTRAYSTSLGPYLLKRVRQLQATWTAAGKR